MSELIRVAPFLSPEVTVGSTLPAFFRDEAASPTEPKVNSHAAPEAMLLCDPCFEIYHAEEVRVTSTMFSGGDWRWQFSVVSGVIVARGAGFSSEMECRAAVTALRCNAQSAKIRARC